MLPDDKDKFNEALRLREKGELTAALALLFDLERSYPTTAAIPGVAGGIYRQLGEHKNAADKFRKAVVISPTSELASRGLFHALWALDQKEEAIAVLHRYLALAESQDFRKILASFEPDESEPEN